MPSISLRSLFNPIAIGKKLTGPGPVRNLTATDFGTGRAYNDGRIDLTWLPPLNFGGYPSVSYVIYRSSGGSPVQIGQTAATSFSDVTLSSNTTYTYTVASRNPIADSSGVNVTATATTVPNRPTNVAATAGDSQATVSFIAPANGGKTITSYTATSSPGSITKTGSSSPLTVTGLTNGTAYTFTVTATNANGTSQPSTPASNSVTPVASPATTWTSRTSPTGLKIQTISYGNGIWVGATEGDIATSLVVRSTNGVSWTTQFPSASNNSLKSSAYGNGIYLVAGASETIRTSTDGITWTTRTFSGGPGAAYSAATYGNGRFIIAAPTFVAPAVLASSTDNGVTWSGSSTTMSDPLGAAYGNGIWVVVGGNGQILRSTNGTTWATQTSNFGSTTIRAVTYGNGVWVAAGDNEQIRSSTDAITWTTRTISGASATPWYGATYGNGRFVLAGRLFAMGPVVGLSTDGITWTTTSIALDSPLATAYGNGLFTMVGDGGAIYTSNAT